MNDQHGITTQCERFLKILSKDATIKYHFMISLKNMAMAKLVSQVWLTGKNQYAINKYFYHFLNKEHTESRDEIEKNVISQISNLPLPKSIIGQLKSLVPNFGKSIFNWVDYHDIYIFETQHHKYSAVGLIKYLKWTTRGKIDCAQTAKAILINENERLTDDHKYKLACTYCLEEEITTIAPLVINLDYLSNISVQDHPMVHFWTAHITNKKDIKDAYYQLREYRGRERSHITFNEYIFWFLLCKSQIFAHILNEVPYKYLWNRLNESERAAYVPLLIQKLRNDDFKYELLSNLNKRQQAEVFKKFHYTILLDILNDWVWDSHFLPTALHVLDIIQQDSYVEILEIILEKRKEQIKNEFTCDRYKYFFKVMWEKRPYNVKTFMLENREYLLVITDMLSWEQDLDIIDLVFDELDITHKKEVIFRCTGISKCASFIVNGQWDLLHLFIKYCLESEDICRLKRSIISLRGEDIMQRCIDNVAFDNASSFMNWAFESDEEKRKFRERFADLKIYEYLESIETTNKADVTNFGKIP